MARPAARPSMVRPAMSTMGLAHSSSGSVSVTPPVCRLSTPDAVAAQLHGQLAAQGLDGREPDLQPAEVELLHRLAVAAEEQHHARALPDHVPGGGPGGDEIRCAGR